MLDDITIRNAIIEKNHELVGRIQEYSELLFKQTETENEYNVAKHKKMLEMKADGETITWINSTAKLDPEVAQLRFEYHVAEAQAKACLQAIKACYTAIDSYRSLLAFEKATKTEL